MCSVKCLWTKLRKCTCNTKKPRIDVRNPTTSHVSNESKGRSSHRKNWICLYFLKAYLLSFRMQMLMEVLLSMHYTELKQPGPVLRPDPCWWGSVISEFECYIIKLRPIANPQHKHSMYRYPCHLTAFVHLLQFLSAPPNAAWCLKVSSLIWVFLVQGQTESSSVTGFFLEWNSEGGEQRCFNKRR